MSRASQARRIAAAAAVGAVGGGGGAFGFLWLQTLLARRRVGDPRGEPFVVDGRYDPPSVGSPPAEQPPFLMAMLGDSGAAGLGADAPEDTVAVLVAQGVAQLSGRPVDLVNLAVVGAQTAHLPAQVTAALEAFGGTPPDVVVMMIGANDVTHRVRPQASVRQLREVITSLRAAGCEVIVGCCPDLGTVEPVPNPLRSIGRRLSRTLAAAQEIVTEEAGGHPVLLGSLLGPEFASKPSEYFSEDRFHPSSVGYRRCAEELLPAVLRALQLPRLVSDPTGP